VADLVMNIVRLAAGWDEPGKRAWCERLEDRARAVPPDAVIYRGRNVIFRDEAGGEAVAVKRFPVASPGKRLVYRLRATKAVRAFDHAVRLAALGVGTPRPLAAVEVRQGGWPLASYFCSAYLPEFREARELRLSGAPDRSLLLGLLGEFVGRLHELGVVHRDLTSGNILLVPDRTRPGGVSFQLVDINRMRFGLVGPRAGVANLVQLRLNDGGEVLEGYCRARGLDPSRLRRLYDARLAWRGVTQAIKERTRPWRRRLGL
jgi:tRNA A-37 threonylcarbamoyl transferase component Bud32